MSRKIRVITPFLLKSTVADGLGNEYEVALVEPSLSWAEPAHTSILEADLVVYDVDKMGLERMEVELESLKKRLGESKGLLALLPSDKSEWSDLTILAGADECLVKPFDSKEIGEAIKKVLAMVREPARAA